MLMSYPDALRGVGPFTINNLLGGALALILVFQIYREHDYWFLREPEVRLLIAIAAWFTFTLLSSPLYLPAKHLLPAVARAGREARDYGQSDDTGRWVFELAARRVLIFFVNISEPVDALLYLLRCIASG
jgi:hypothetical protein